MTNATGGVVVVAGAALVHAGMAGILRDLVDRTNIGVFNSWAAKGLFPWNHPAHLGTIGLQTGDIELCALATFDDVVLCGVSDDELRRGDLTRSGVRWRDVEPIDLDGLVLSEQPIPTPKPPLFDLLATASAPLYVDQSSPCSPARAAADLAAALPPRGLVSADAGRSGFWLGRTFPTRELGSVLLPTRVTPGFAATQAATVRRTGRFSVAVMDCVDDATESVMERATDLVIEVWCDDGDKLDPSERIGRLREANEARGVHVLSLAVRFSDIDVLIKVAGAPLWHP